MINLARVKEQLRLDADLTDEDPLISSYLAAGQIAAANYIDRPLVWNESTEIAADDTLTINATDEIELSVLLMVGHWYAARESVVIGTIVSEVPFAFKFLLDPYRIL